MRHRAILVSLLANVMLVGMAQAQSWEAVSLPESSSSAAGLRWETGAAAVARCEAGAFSLMFIAVHESETTQSHFRLNGGDWERVHWAAAERPQLFFSRTAARMARKFLGGGDLELRFTSDDQPPVLYQLDLPSDATALTGVMDGCGIPLSDVRDDIQIADDLRWIARPSGNDLARHYPDRGRQGDGSILCVISRDGSLTDCEVTYDTPPGAGFGDATRALAPRFRLHRDQAAEFEGWLVSIPVSWRLG